LTATIELIGLVVYGWHGVLERERGEGQRFLFDVWLDVPDDAARSDRIEDAVDYRQVAETVRAVSDSRALHLLEALAAAVADALVERFPVARVRVRVRKPDVRLDAGPVEWSAVTVEREASEPGPSRSSG
jgi:dihydroneopterin aldolase